MEYLMLFGLLAAGVGVALFTSLLFRKVVPTNEVHIVQSGKSTTSYGKDSGNGNSYYQWPSFLPFIGVTKSVLSTSVFDLKLDSYEAYDKGRLPFEVDVVAFFRVSDSNIAAQRVSNHAELVNQLTSIVQGAVRSILASSEIEEIMQGRSTFGEQFTNEVKEQLSNWGVTAVKNIELMDIRDSNGSNVIKNIMDKRKSFIEMQSRQEVAANQKVAKTAEIEAQREVELKQQEASQTIGLRKIEAARQVSLSDQQKIQAIKEQEKVTKTKEMEVLQVQEVRKAEILKQMTLIKSEQDKQTSVIKAEADKDSALLVAAAKLETTKLDAEGIAVKAKAEAEGIAAQGKAKAEAEKAIQLAPVEAQITLAKEIGENKAYQEYLVTIRKVEASEKIGMEQAKALEAADVKIISNTSSPTEGLTNVMDIFSSKGGTQVGAMLEGLANTDTGKALISKLVPQSKENN